MHTVSPKVESLKPLKQFLDMPPLRILGLKIDVKHEVIINLYYRIKFILSY